MQSELLQLMGNRFPIGISARNGLWGDWEGIDGGFHASMRDDRLKKVNDFRTFLFTEPKPATA
jgi:hypothetical protein